ncbi:probable glycosyltransferase At5g03795 [Lycium ferocissimum]|uniref:probable glycosyltransferase At5g03795 n=1 Tax=Lycium ferocissimum TaxID=112874 RepID=UPI002814EC8A|nr:probable glycosyltransferase At5g03795 [Lycium ferocissimum]XP_059275038.1 probable glycosyltransferase At5g03795 [Lycium ferocissimum]
MGSDFHLFLCRAETRRVLWVMGGVFAFSILVQQYFELPYGNFIGSLCSGVNSNRTNNVNTQFNFTVGFDGKMKRNDSIFPIEPNDSSGVELLKPNRDLAPERAKEFENIFKGKNENVAPMLEEQSKDDIAPLASNISLPPMISPAPSVSLRHVDDNSIVLHSSDNPGGATTTQNNEVVAFVPLKSNAAVQTMNSPAPSVSLRHVDDNSTTAPNKATELLRNDLALSGNASTLNKALAVHDNLTTLASSHTPYGAKTPSVKEASDKPVKGVVSISEMTNMLLRSHHPSNLLTNPKWSSASDEELLSAKSQIESAANSIGDLGLHAPVYHNVSKFIRSYELMERNLKVYIYREGKRPVFHQSRLTGIYASEGWFMKQLKASQHFLTKDPNKAHLFYLPFSSQILEEVLYVPGSHSFTNLKAYLKNYVDLIKGRYPFWNRTQGADHFLVACHDWAPEETRREMANCIKSLCNADLKEGFKLGKDASLPETNIGSADPSRSLGGKRPSQRKFLAFFAGSMHGYVRPILLKHWQNKDPNMKIFGRMRKTDYIHHMKSTKYCICARGYEVNSPRVVEAVSYECVPVIISDNFVPPFLETLNWESFAVFVLEKDIPNLKSILESISLRRYLKLYNNVIKVQQHFLWHPEPVKYDMFHMILHSIWYNRVFQIAS